MKAVLGASKKSIRRTIGKKLKADGKNKTQFRFLQFAKGRALKKQDSSSSASSSATSSSADSSVEKVNIEQ